MCEAASNLIQCSRQAQPDLRAQQSCDVLGADGRQCSKANDF